VQADASDECDQTACNCCRVASPIAEREKRKNYDSSTCTDVNRVIGNGASVNGTQRGASLSRKET